ncbi:family 16 glycoside hydrolase [Algoriphagus aquatilis]|uniref:Family 16 glycoside hydrolase n=1 Tax=Algoriphagus aquatilis TaxID=490186 RepID=A0ABW0BU28_9BACT
MKKHFIILALMLASLSANAQTLKLKNQEFELHNVTGEIVEFQGKKALKIERDLTAIPFDSTRVEATVDEPHYARLLGLEDFENGTIEVKMYSQLKVPAPYSGIAGFIGLFFRVQEDDSAFESIYVRPKVGRSDNQLHRNHAVQYFSYPQYKFDTLRKIAPHRYEGSAPVALNEWFTMRIEVNGETAELFINNLKYSSFIVDKMLGTSKKGFVGLYVDIGTIGYFRDLKVTKRAYQEKKAGDEVSDI